MSWCKREAYTVVETFSWHRVYSAATTVWAQWRSLNMVEYSLRNASQSWRTSLVCCTKGAPNSEHFLSESWQWGTHLPSSACKSQVRLRIIDDIEWGTLRSSAGCHHTSQVHGVPWNKAGACQPWCRASRLPYVGAGHPSGGTFLGAVKLILCQLLYPIF